METILIFEIKVRGTGKEINRVKARFAALSACEEVVSMTFLKKRYEQQKNAKSVGL